MKLAFLDDFKLGVVAGDKVVDVTDAVKDIPRLGPQDVMRGVIERFDALKDRLVDAAAKGHGKTVSQARLRPPLLKPEKSSSGRESHPSALTEPDVKLAPHPAPTLQPPVARQAATGRTDWGPVARCIPASASMLVPGV